MKPFYKSRKFMIAILDAFAGILALVVGRFLQPEDATFVLQLFGLMQPVLLAWIVAISVEDSAALKAGTHPAQLKRENK